MPNYQQHLAEERLSPAEQITKAIMVREGLRAEVRNTLLAYVQALLESPQRSDYAAHVSQAYCNLDTVVRRQYGNTGIAEYPDMLMEKLQAAVSRQANARNGRIHG